MVAVGVLAFTACAEAPKADNAETGDKKEVATGGGAAWQLDTLASSVNWTGTKPTGQHTGMFKVQSGTFNIQDGKLTGGSFVINVASNSVTDLKPEQGKGKLEEHLAGTDFFDVAKYPSASFEITSVAAYDSSKMKSVVPGATHLISGNLKLKDSTKNVTFPAKITLTDAALSAVADFNIDRTQWGMAYGNKESLGDKFIRPTVNIKLNIAAKK